MSEQRLTTHLLFPFRRLAVAASLLLACVALLWVVPVLAQDNLWSLQVLHRSLPNAQVTVDLASAPPGHARAILWGGLAALAHADADQAVALLEPAVCLDPHSPLLGAILGRAYEAQGRLPQALRAWQQAGAWGEIVRSAQRALAAQRWDDALAALQFVHTEQVVSLQVQAFAGKKDLAGAAATLRAALVCWPNSGLRHSWLVLLGNYLSWDSRWAEAVAAYRQALADDDGPSSWFLHIQLGQALYSGGQGLDAAAAEVQRGIALAPEQATGYAAMGSLLRADQRYAEADDWYRRAVELDPGNVNRIAQRINNLVVGNQLPAALLVLQEAIASSPDQPRLHSLLADIYRRQGSLELAISSQRQAMELDRANVSYRLQLGAFYEQAGRPQEALQTYREAVALNQGNATSHVALGRLLYQTGGGLERAADELQRAVELAPQSSAAYTELARLYQMEKRYAEAEIWYRQAVERSAQDAGLWLQRSNNALQAGDVTLAVQILEQAVLRLPNSARVYFSLAQAYRRAGAVDRAVAAIARTVALGPTENVSYWVEAGTIYERAQQSQQALQAFRQALSLDASNKPAQQGIARLTR